MTCNNSFKIKCIIIMSLISTLFSLNGYGKDEPLSRSEASEIIKKQFFSNVPYQTTKITIGIISMENDCFCNRDNISMMPLDVYSKLAEKGFVELSDFGKGNVVRCDCNSFRAKLTDLGRKKFNFKDKHEYRSFVNEEYSVELCKNEFKEVTGILKKSDTLVQVEFSWNCGSPTEFYPIFLQNIDKKYTQLHNNNVDMAKYDDGWRIVGKK